MKLIENDMDITNDNFLKHLLTNIKVMEQTAFGLANV
jgi:hypothetical protein